MRIFLVIALLLCSCTSSLAQAYVSDWWSKWSEEILGCLYWFFPLLFVIIVTITVILGGKRARNVEDWLDQHYSRLPKRAQKKLLGLRNERRGRPRYSQRWSDISANMRKRRPNCEICNAPTRHMHHRRYRRFGRDKPRDLMALCDMCHYFIHPGTGMTRKAFKEYKERR